MADGKHPMGGKKPPGMDHPPHGNTPLLAGHKKGGPMSHSTGGRRKGGSRDYDPPGTTGITINPGGVRPMTGD